MTVIAWDGRTLAADKQMTSGMTKLATKKLHRHGDFLLAFCGDASAGLETLQWFIDGAVASAYPPGNRVDGQGASLIAIGHDGKVLKYEKSPYPFEVEGKFCAFGCGDESAMVAMHCGKTAAEAVAITSIYNTGCGCGVDTLDFTTTKEAHEQQ